MEHQPDKALKAPAPATDRRVVHISTLYNGGAGIAAFRIHEALLGIGIDSKFMCVEQDINDKVINIYASVDSGRLPPGTTRKIITKVIFRFNNWFSRSRAIRKSYHHKLLYLKDQLSAEIATLPFSNIRLSESPEAIASDILHLHWVAQFIDYPYFFNTNRKPVVWTLHDMNPFQGIFHYKGDEERNKLVAAGLDCEVAKIKRKAVQSRHCSLFLVAPSAWLLNLAQASEVFANVPGAVIRYPVNFGRFFIERDINFKIEHQVPAHHFVLMVVAQNISNPRKGFDLLQAAQQQLAGEPVTFIIVGDVSSIAAETPHCIPVGVINSNAKLRYYYSNADALVLPSREDNLPNVMLESMACGTPVIGFKTGGIEEMVIDGETGLLAKEMNAVSLAASIMEFIQGRHSFNRERIHAFVKAQCDPDLVAKQYEEVYRNLLTHK